MTAAATCRVLLVGEGPTDIGDLAIEEPYRRGREGFMQPLLRSMVGTAVELEFVGRKIVHLPKTPHGRRLKQLQADAATRALALASALEARALVLVFDADKSHGKKATRIERRRRLNELRASALDGFRAVRVDDIDAKAIHTAVAIPCRMIEAWGLADRAALSTLLGEDPASLDYGPPEGLWGDEKDPSSNHPKRVWERVTRGEVTFSAVAEQVDVATLERECPESFPPFARDVEAALDTCAAARTSIEPGTARGRRRRHPGGK